MRLRSIDYTLFFLVFGFMIFGMIMISSVSVYPSFKVTSAMVANGSLDAPTNSFYLIRNIIHVLLSGTIFALIVKIPYEFFERYARHFFLASLGLLFIVLFVGSEYNGAKGWINIPHVPFSIQPVEFAKLALILYLASFMKRQKALLHTFESWFVPFALIVSAVVGLLALQPDFGSILIIGPLAVMLFFLGGGSLKSIAIIGACFAVLGSSVYALGRHEGPQDRNTLSYITDRIDNFLSDNQTLIKSRTINFQTEQGLLAIGSGGFFGVGFGKSIQKFGYLPEAEGDFIFSVLAEELGFVGVCFVIGLYLFIAYRWFRIARGVDDLFARYVALGITIWIVWQAFVNIGVNLNIVPLTGVTLPFVSYGGSSLMALMIGVAILLNISRGVQTAALDSPKSPSFRRKVA